MWFQFGSSCGTQRSLSSCPASSLVRKTAITLTGITQPGNVGADTQTIASSGRALLGQRALDEAVVGRIDDRGEQEAVELDRLQALVPLVLVARPLRDLDQAVEGVGPVIEPASIPTSRRGRDVLKEFRDFVLRGNVVDLAVAVVIGAAFGAVVTAFTAAFITPLIALIGGKPDFSDLRSRSAARASPTARSSTR